MDGLDTPGSEKLSEYSGEAGEGGGTQLWHGLQLPGHVPYMLGMEGHASPTGLISRWSVVPSSSLR